LRRHRAGDGAEDEADEDDGVAEAAADRAEQLAHGIEHVLGQPAAFEDRSHEGEERDRQQQFVRQHVAEDAAGNGLQEAELEEALVDGDSAEAEAERRQREGDRITDQHQDHETAKHQRRHPLQRDHCCGLSYFASMRVRPSSAAMRLMTSETPWIASMTKPAGSTNLIGQRMRPPVLPDTSLVRYDSWKNGQDR